MTERFEQDGERGLTIALDRESEQAQQTKPTSSEAQLKYYRPPAPRFEQGDRHAGERAAQLSGFPIELARSYALVSDQNGAVNRVYGNACGRELFCDYGAGLAAKQADHALVKAMLDIAQHRNWHAIMVVGAQDLRRRAWLEACTRAISVRGYEPTGFDRQVLIRQAVAQQQLTGASSLKTSVDPQGAVEDARAPIIARQSPVRIDYRQGIEGKVIEVGRRPYRDDPDATPSPYVELELADGKKHIVWGMGLPDALRMADVGKGDRIALRQSGRETISVTLPRKVHGEFQQTRVERRGWDVRRLACSQDGKADRVAELSSDPLCGGADALSAGARHEIAVLADNANAKRQ